MTKLKNLLLEFEEDLSKKMVLIMGLPASGKSTFIKNDIQKFIPGFSGFSTSNTDSGVLALQYETAKTHFDYIKKNVKTEEDLNKFLADTSYTSNSGTTITLPLSMKWINTNISRGIKTYYDTFYKPYYATYFDIRDLAKKMTQDIFKTKIMKTSDLVVIDSTGVNTDLLLGYFEDAKKNNFTTTVIYLEIDPNLCIARDEFRRVNSGRGVGENVIMGYASKMESSFSKYEGIAQDPNKDLIDRIIRCKWNPAGDSPIKGNWDLMEDKRYSVKKRALKLSKK